MFRIILVLAALTLLVLVAAPALADEEVAGKPSLRVVESAFGTAIVDRMPDGGAESYQLGGKVYCWTRIRGGGEGDFVYHVWYFGEREIQSVELAVNGSHWRTWSYKTLYPGMAGEWRVEVQNSHGEVMGTYRFTATE